MLPLPLLESERSRLLSLLAGLERDWNRVPKLFWTCLVGVPVTYVSGLAWGLVAVAMACSFVGTTAYLIGVRRREYERELRDIDKEIQRAR